MMSRLLPFTAAVALLCAEARGIIFASTGDPTFNTTEPTGAFADSGWQFQGHWNGFLATPISPQYFIAASHIGGAIGGTFEFQGANYVTDSTVTISGTDLALWHVTSTFPTYAPLYRKGNEVGKELVVFGAGTQRGGDVLVSGSLHGWFWGPGDGVQRWGTNSVASTSTSSIYGNIFTATFTPGNTPFEAHLSVGDSSGGIFIKDNDGTWKLAGINLGVSGPYYTSILGEGGFNAALFDQSGFFEQSGKIYVPVTGPGSFTASRISTNVAAIDAITSAPEPTAAVAFACGIASMSCMRLRRRTAA